MPRQRLNGIACGQQGKGKGAAAEKEFDFVEIDRHLQKPD